MKFYIAVKYYIYYILAIIYEIAWQLSFPPYFLHLYHAMGKIMSENV